MSLLEVAGLESGYGSIQVLWSVDMNVQANETVVLLGPNGAGKTTLLKCLVGLLPARGGTIRFAGADITRFTPRARVRAGISYMSELGVFPDMTVEENIDLGALFVDRAVARRRRAELYALFPILIEKRRQAAGGLSGGQRKMLGVAKALAAEPKLLVMDEPSAGLSPLFVKEVLRILGDLRGRLTGGKLAQHGGHRGGARAPAADVEGARFVVTGLARDQAVPVEGAEQGPCRHGTHVGALCARRPRRVPHFDEPA